MKKTSKKAPSKKKAKEESYEDWTPEQIKRWCADAGFNIVLPDQPKKAFGKSEDQLNKETVIIPEGSNRGFKVKM